METEKEELADASGKGALEPYDPKLDLENYHYPTLELLDKRNDEDAPIDMEEQNKNKDQIIEVLQNFGVGISSIKATVGPTITLYEITPAEGVRISHIKNLEDDIALSLSGTGHPYHRSRYRAKVLSVLKFRMPTHASYRWKVYPEQQKVPARPPTNCLWH